MRREHLCWAIDTNSPEGHGLLGIFCWFDGKPPALPMHVKGNRAATWPTRRAARAALANMKSAEYVAWPKACVRRVRLTVEAV